MREVLLSTAGCWRGAVRRKTAPPWLEDLLCRTWASKSDSGTVSGYAGMVGSRGVGRREAAE
jgi:hypothetical protein